MEMSVYRLTTYKNRYMQISMCLVAAFMEISM